MSDEKRVFVTMEAFVTAWEGSANVDEVVAKTGLKKTSIMARASKYRSENIPLKLMKRGAGKKLDATAAKVLLATLRGVEVEEVEKASVALAEKRAEKTETA